MPLLLLSVLIAVPLIEIGVFIQVGGAIGLWPTLGAIVLTALAGSALIRHQGLAILGQARDSFAAGRLPVREIFDGICLLLAGALLLTPGFVTDAIGALFLVPTIRGFIRTAVLTQFLDRHGDRKNGDASARDGEPTTIEGKYSVAGSNGEPHEQSSIANRDAANENQGPAGRTRT